MSASRTRETLIILRVLQDHDDAPPKPWWDALGLRAPEYWTDCFGEDVFATVEIEFDRTHHNDVEDSAAPQPVRYKATFHPQAWVRDIAIPVDPAGETSWDATEYVAELLREGVYRDGKVKPEYAVEWLQRTLESGDLDDILRNDPNAPDWVRDWNGPFDTELEVVA